MAYQVLDPSKLNLYPPNSTTRDEKSGAVFLKDGVKPVSGTVKTVGDPTNPGSLKGTMTGSSPTSVGLIPGGPSAVQTPSGSIDQLSALKQVLGNMSTMAQQAGIVKNTGTLAAGLSVAGMGADHTPGSVLEQMMGIVESNTTKPIQQEFSNLQSTIESIANQRQQATADAKTQLSTMMANGMWNKLTDAQRQTVWTAAGFLGKPEVQQKTGFEHTTDADGHVWNVQYDLTSGKILSKTDMGTIGKPSKGSKGGAPSPIDGLSADQAKQVQAFNTDMLDPTKVGVKGGVATRGEEQSDPTSWVTRDQLIAKLTAKWGRIIDPNDIATAVYKAYPDAGTPQA